MSVDEEIARLIIERNSTGREASHAYASFLLSPTDINLRDYQQAKDRHDILVERIDTLRRRIGL